MLIDVTKIAVPYLSEHAPDERIWIDLAACGSLRVVEALVKHSGSPEGVKLMGVQFPNGFFLGCRDAKAADELAEILAEKANEDKLGHYKASAAVQQSGIKAWADEIKKW